MLGLVKQALHVTCSLLGTAGIVQYARRYLSVGREGYQKVWYQLHTAPDASKWPNILLILSFSSVYLLPTAMWRECSQH